MNINEHGDEKNLNTSETDAAAANTNRLFSHMIISHNQELMIHAIAFGSNNPMSKIAPSYVVSNENESHISLNDLEELMEEIDDENLEKDLRVDVKQTLQKARTLPDFFEEFSQYYSNNNTLSIGNDFKRKNSN